MSHLGRFGLASQGFVQLYWMQPPMAAESANDDVQKEADHLMGKEGSQSSS